MASDAPALRRIRILLIIFIVGLVLSGITAFPLVTELKMLNAVFGPDTDLGRAWPALGAWIGRVHIGLSETQAAHPWMFYGYDWLAFAHLVIAVAFWGPYVDPVRNKWVITFGMIACLGILPLALIAGPIRGIPVFWTLIDCSFCFGALIPLWLIQKQIAILENGGKA
jgi:hypothetical protein